ncbi:protein kinase domain-containing protein [Singulisphaera sp. PoT]|uniref:protein kinase domain-containing protein n=1 Tax=Singulisphaera sp. PoT TaxID=3411797 RepID=UPI003BF5072E
MVSRIYRTHCDESKLRSFLDDRLTSIESNDLAEHLDDCEGCRKKLERLAAGNRLWAELRQLAPDPDASTPETEYIPPFARDEVEAGSRAELGLDFLAPSADPGSIGKLGAYEVTGVLGRGGFGVVLKAFDPALSRTVAIKVLASNLATSAAARSRFAREAKAAAAVVHENVVAIHAVDEWKGLPYLVMPYIAGRSVQQRIDRDGPLEVKEILRIGVQTAQGLAAAHAQGLVHRDVKPSNILLENGVERVKLSDFGLARAVDDASLTQSGVVAGTPQYMSPEQANGDAVDHRSDLFGLGSVLYFMCAGFPPFRANSTPAVLLRVRDDRARPLREINPDIPEGLAAVVEKLHAKAPGRRYGSAEEVADVLQRQLADLQRTPASRARARVRKPFRKMGWKTKTAIGLMLGSVFAFFLANGDELPPLPTTPAGVFAPPVPPTPPNANATAKAPRRGGLFRFLFNGGGDSRQTITGSGTASSKTWEAAEFSAIAIASTFQAEIVKGDAFKLVTTTDDNLQDHIRVTQKGPSLSIEMEPNLNYRTKLPLKVEITLPRLEKLALDGASKATLKGFRGEPKFEADIDGASTLVGELAVESLDLEADGTSSVSLTGGAGTAKISADGTSRLRLAEFPIKVASLELDGSTHAHVNVQSGDQPFRADVNGSSVLEGTVTAPEVQIEAEGSSTVKLVGAAGGAKIESNGSSHVDLSKLILDAREVQVVAEGSGDIQLAGKAASLQLKGGGSSQFKLAGLSVDDAGLFLEGATLARIHVNKSLSYVIASGSQIRYSGKPASVKGQKSSGASVSSAK